jgi:hypothetical protein
MKQLPEILIFTLWTSWDKVNGVSIKEWLLLMGLDLTTYMIILAAMQLMATHWLVWILQLGMFIA